MREPQQSAVPIWGFLLALLLPIVGFIWAVVLFARSEAATGVGMLIASVAGCGIGLELLSS